MKRVGLGVGHRMARPRSSGTSSISATAVKGTANFPGGAETNTWGGRLRGGVTNRLVRTTNGYLKPGLFIVSAWIQPVAASWSGMFEAYLGGGGYNNTAAAKVGIFVESAGGGLMRFVCRAGDWHHYNGGIAKSSSMALPSKPVHVMACGNLHSSDGTKWMKIYVDGVNVTESVTAKSGGANVAIASCPDIIFDGASAGSIVCASTDYYKASSPYYYYVGCAQAVVSNIYAYFPCTGSVDVLPEKFRADDGGPLDIGSNGSLAMGYQPDIYLTGGLSGMMANKGYLSFTHSEYPYGSLTVGPSGLTDIQF